MRGRCWFCAKVVVGIDERRLVGHSAGAQRSSQGLRGPRRRGEGQRVRGRGGCSRATQVLAAPAAARSRSRRARLRRACNGTRAPSAVLHLWNFVPSLVVAAWTEVWDRTARRRHGDRRGSSRASRCRAPLRTRRWQPAERRLGGPGPPCARRWAAARQPAAGPGGPPSHIPAPTISRTCAERRALVSNVRAGEGGGREKLDAQPSDSTASRRWRRRTTRRGGGSLGPNGSTAAAGRVARLRSLCAPPGVAAVAAAAGATRPS